LDAQVSDETMRLFLKIREHGTTIMIASHDIALIQRYGTRIISLQGGYLAADLQRVKKQESER